MIHMKKEFTVVAISVIMLVVVMSGCTQEKEKIPPMAAISLDADLPILPNDTIMFSADDSYDKDGNINSYYWDLGNGITSNEKNVEHQFSDFGTHTVSLQIIDNDGLSNITTKTIEVEVIPAVEFKISQLSYNETENSYIFNISVNKTLYHNVNIEDTLDQINEEYSLGNEGGGGNDAVPAYIDVDGNGYYSVGDYLHKTYTMDEANEVVSITYVLFYRHNGHSTAIGEVDWDFT